MTKRALILHSTDSAPENDWLPWMRNLLEAAGYEVFAPLLPENKTPNRHTYEKFLQDSGWDFTNNIIVGHSSGATTALNLLSSDWFPNASTVILAGTFLNQKLTKDADWVQPGQFDNLFLDNYDATAIKKRASSFYFVHGSNDPYCDIDDARNLCEELGGKFIVIQNGHHLGSSSGLTELPKLADQLRHDGII
ncbi:MAG: alpha/beta hydrolase [Candidatus Saccharibacteria bacterium]|nr:alpha/beta hydrolase [Candidatus Saccharibacteria bacterium]